jgi:chromosome segregation ATPase
MSEKLAEEKVETTEEEKDVEVTLDENVESASVDTAETAPDTGQSEQKTEEPDDKELQDVGKRAQDRIKKLTTKYKNEERAKQEAERKAQEAALENEKLKERLKNLDQGYISEYGTRLDAQLEQAKKNYRDAHEAGDVDKMFDAQQALSKISIEQERHRIAKDRQEAQVKEVEQQAQQPQTQPQPQQAPVDPKAQAWAERNEWFGEDQVMTSTAMGIHQKLSEEGFDLSSDEYYDEIDRQLKTLFPDKFNTGRANGGSARVAPADTSASRKKQGRRTVRLSPSQVAIAKKLNVPLEEYAKYVKE